MTATINIPAELHLRINDTNIPIGQIDLPLATVSYDDGTAFSLRADLAALRGRIAETLLAPKGEADA